MPIHNVCGLPYLLRGSAAAQLQWNQQQQQRLQRLAAAARPQQANRQAGNRRPPTRPQATSQRQRTQGMGPQSQCRISLQDRTHRSAANSNRRSGQRTLVGDVAFDPTKDCPICKARHYNLRIPHRGHHKNCWNNPRTGGITSQTSLDTLRIGKAREKFFQQGLKTSEK